MTITLTAAQQIAFEAIVTATAAAHNITREQAIYRLIESGVTPETMPQ